MHSRISLLILFLSFNAHLLFSQNVGIGTDNPGFTLEVIGSVGISSLAGTNNRMVIANDNGKLSTQAIPLFGPLNSLTNVSASPITGQALVWNGTQWVAGTVGDITGVSAGAGLVGGGSEGTPILSASANNGLNVDLSADRIQLGGSLIKSTTISNGIYSMNFNLNSTGDFKINDNGATRFSVQDNGNTTIGSTANVGRFNVTGNSFYSDDLYLRDGSVTNTNLIRLYDSSDDGVIDIYRAGFVANRLNGNGNSFINGGNLGLGTSTPVRKLHVVGSARISDLAGGSDKMVVANGTGDLSTQPIPVSGVSQIIAGDGLIGGGANNPITLTAAANNGLVVDPIFDKIQLGGNLTEHTTITNGLFNLIFNLNSSGDFFIRDNGLNRFSVLDNGRTTIGSTANAGQFNVTGNSFYSDDLLLRDGSVSGTNLIRLFDSSDDGVIDIYRAGGVVNRLHGNGNSFINGGNLGLGTTVPVQKLHIVGTARISALAGGSDKMVVANTNGDLSTQALPIGDISTVIAGTGLTGGGTSGSITLNAVGKNGIRTETNSINLGGPLTENTTITHNTFDLSYNLNSTGNFLIKDSNFTRFSVLNNGKTNVGGINGPGQFNVDGLSFFGDALAITDGFPGQAVVRLTNDLNNGRIDVLENGAVTTRISAANSSYFTGGLVGFGTTTPQRQLHVEGSARISSLGGLGVRNVISNNSGDLFTLPLSSRFSGYFTGDIYASRTFFPSYKGLKKNIKDQSSSLEALLGLSVKNYNYRTEEYNLLNLPEGRQTGIMSEDLKQNFPTLVKEVSPLNEYGEEVKEKSFEAVNYVGLIPHLVRGLQEQNQNYKAQNKKLLKEINQLEKSLEKEVLRSQETNTKLKKEIKYLALKLEMQNKDILEIKRLMKASEQ